MEAPVLFKEQVEILEIIDADGNVIGTAPRGDIHGNPELMHKVVHVLVFMSNGDLILQKRALSKDVAPGMWDTSVGGHMEPGESIEHAAQREMLEELGFNTPLEYIYSYVYSDNFETEKVFTFMCTYDGEIRFNTDEIDEVKPWSLDMIRSNIDAGILSNNFIREFQTFKEHRENQKN
jgi:isopentenyldiphosphate isomerase